MNDLPEGYEQRATDEVFQLWLAPEIDRRRARGEIGDDFELRAAQVTWTAEGDQVVRLNDEVLGRVTVHIRAAPHIVERGETDLSGLADVTEILGIEPHQEDVNAAYITLLRRGDGWVFGFDFTFNAGQIKRRLSTARDFLDGAASELTAGRLGTFVDLAFGAVELLVTATLAERMSLSALRTHADRDRAHKLAVKAGDDRRFLKLREYLWNRRGAARYGHGDLNMTVADARTRLALAEELYEIVVANAARRARRDQPPAS